MNNRFESEKFEPDPTFERDMNEIKDSYMKIIASAATNPSVIISFDDNFDPLFINNSSKAEKFEPEPTFDRLLMISKTII